MSNTSSGMQQTIQGTPGAKYALWKDLLSTGVHALQPGLIESEAEATTQRGFMPATIPGLLQTPEFARRIFERNAEKLEGAPDTIDEAVLLRMRRQEVLRSPGKTFHIVMTEAPLHYGLVPPDAMRAQLEKLVEASTLPSVQLGVIPFSAMPAGRIPLHGFWIHDDRWILVETFAAELRLSQPDEIDLYAQVFDQMAAAAVYGNEARQLISRIAHESAA